MYGNLTITVVFTVIQPYRHERVFIERSIVALVTVTGTPGDKALLVFTLVIVSVVVAAILLQSTSFTLGRCRILFLLELLRKLGDQLQSFLFAVDACVSYAILMKILAWSLLAHLAK